jgi:hypothetical protein
MIQIELLYNFKSRELHGLVLRIELVELRIEAFMNCIDLDVELFWI